MTTPVYDDQNVFAKILRGEIPSEKVYEDDRVVVIMDVMPQAAGHSLVIPKAPSRNILDIAPDDLAYAIGITAKVARAAKRAFAADGINIMQFNEPASGQTVFHTHIHVIPRHDGVALKPHTGQMAPRDEIAATGAKLRAAIAQEG